MAENQIEKLMRVLHCSKEEAEDIIKTDKAIDKGERTEYDLSPEKEKMAKKIAKIGMKTKKNTGTGEKRNTHKENPIKSSIIAEIADFLEKNSKNSCKNVKITNKERQIAFSVDENSYELTLVQKRKPKN